MCGDYFHTIYPKHMHTGIALNDGGGKHLRNVGQFSLDYAMCSIPEDSYLNTHCRKNLNSSQFCTVDMYFFKFNFSVIGVRTLFRGHMS